MSRNQVVTHVSDPRAIVPFQTVQQVSRHRRQRKEEQDHRQHEQEGLARGLAGLVGQPDHILQTHDRDDRSGFQHHQPGVGETGQREAQHLRKDDPQQDPPRRQADCLRGLDLALRHR